jgi:proteasome lid subunit RPN8/RPN11
MKIEASILEELRKCARSSGSVECCGLLWSRPRGPIIDFTPYPGPLFAERFEISDEWLLEQYYRGRQAGLKVEGYYHSHPRAPAEPSVQDLEGHPTGSLCLILTPQRSVRAFRLDGGRFTEQEIEPL